MMIFEKLIFNNFSVTFSKIEFAKFTTKSISSISLFSIECGLNTSHSIFNPCLKKIFALYP